MKNKLKYLATALSTAVAISLWGYGGFPAAAEESDTVTLKKTIETTDPEMDVAEIFTEEYIEGNIVYHLQGIEKQIISSRPEVEEETISIVTDPVYDEPELENTMPEETVVQNGITYYLVNSEVINSMTEERTEYGKTTIAYYDVEYVDELPETGKVTVTDSVTGKEYVKSLPLSDYTITEERWKDDFTFPVTIYSVDANYYMLGDLAIPKDADLGQYGYEFLSYLNLDSEYYKVNTITLQGDPFEQDGEWIQKATAYGSRRTVDVAATYEGSVAIPPEATWQYQCVYSNISPKDALDIIYTLKITAVYVQVSEEVISQEVTKPFWKYLIDFITNPVILAALLILVFAIVVLMLFKRKKKKTESDITYILNSEEKEE